MNNIKPVNILEPGGGVGQCLSYNSLQERRYGQEAFQTSLKKEEQEEDEVKKKEDDDDE